MPLLLLLAFILVPLAEIYVLIQVGEAIGVLPTIALLLLDSFVGTALMRSQGRAAWRRFNEALAAGRMPHKEVADGFLVILGGALLLAPGFLTDVVGILFLLPPTRAAIRPLLIRTLMRRMLAGVGAPGGPGGPGFGSGSGSGSGSGGPGGAREPGGVTFGFGGFGPPPGARGGRRPTDGDGDVVDGTAHEVDPRELR